MGDFIDSLGFGSLAKVYKTTEERFPDVKKREVKTYLDSLGTDYKNDREMERKMSKSYSGYIGGWQMDIFIYDRKYYLLAINMNNRYACISHVLEDRSISPVLPEIKRFVNKFKPVSISSNNEASFVSKEDVNYLISENVELRVITEQIHSNRVS